MDLSKLPKFSQTPPPPAENLPPSGPAMLFCECGAPVAAGSRFCPHCGRKFQGFEPTGDRSSQSPVEAYLNIAIGALTLLMFPRFWQWASSRLLGTHFDEFMLNNVVVPYQKVPEFWSDLGPATFAMMLILDGILAGLVRRRWALQMDIALMGIVTLYNSVHLLRTFSTQGLALVSAIAVIYGGFLFFARLSAAQKIAPTAGKTAGAQGG